MENIKENNIGELDPLFQQAVAECIKAGLATETMLRRRFSIGYPRAARLINQMEQAGYISESRELGGREVYLSKEDYEKMFGEKLNIESDKSMTDEEMIISALKSFIDDNSNPSASFLRRKFAIGYPRAAKLIDKMEEMGYISQVDENMHREVLITKKELGQIVVK